jgi:hypothetical protein
MAQPRGSSSVSIFRAVASGVVAFPLSVFAVLVLGGAPAVAQRVGATNTLLDAPVPKEQTAPPADARPQGGWKKKVAILGKKSVFFPELAHQRGPLTTHQKLQLAVDESVAPSRLLSSAFTSTISQARDSFPEYGQGWDGYGKRYGASMATNASYKAFGTFLLPSMSHQDPRYFVRLQGRPRTRILYAISRVIITQADSGRQAVNISGLLGGLMAEGLANSYLPDDERSGGKTFKRFGVRVGWSALGNVVKEYWPNISKRLRLSKAVPDGGSNATTVRPEPVNHRTVVKNRRFVD